jgi:arginine decarboxylase
MDADIAHLTNDMYLSDLEPAMLPCQAQAAIAHREHEAVEIDKLEGRITTSLVVPYPPGIPLLIPGERFNATIVKYLKFARSFNAQFPGFETEIQGLSIQEDAKGFRYFVDCVKP